MFSASFIRDAPKQAKPNLLRGMMHAGTEFPEGKGCKLVQNQNAPKYKNFHVPQTEREMYFAHQPHLKVEFNYFQSYILSSVSSPTS